MNMKKSNRITARVAHCLGCGRRVRLDGIGICRVCRTTDCRHNTPTTPYFDGLRQLYGAAGESVADGIGHPQSKLE
jgi:hypothetical protein